MTIKQTAEKIISVNPEIKVLYNEELSKHTSFRIGGKCEALFLPTGYDQLETIYTQLKENGITPKILGNGTNILAASGDLPFAVIKTTEMSTLVRSVENECEIVADCGVTLARIAQFAAECGLTGLEFAHGIPGTVGGAVSMNAGAYGGEIKDVCVSVQSFDGSGFYEIEGEEMDFSYRHSYFSDKDDIVVCAVFRLKPGDTKEIKAKMNELAQKRRSSQPLDKPSAGSTFKRPTNGYAAAMIQEAGLKGFTVGNAQVSEKHSGFVVNLGGAVYADVMGVIEHVQKTVFEQTGTMLEPEVKIWN